MRTLSLNNELWEVEKDFIKQLEQTHQQLKKKRIAISL